ncbi:hypothetical protein BGZ99_002671 [Dissophora globulifera]|uniref:Uncharacterized protein n=1 Tax=Dissophora globulifera TaxID=979702 RepID=A0A9P6RS23_9FUNG|nr:hypothetical protein BGZ99_002671 [Dissophora globulifera]
MLTGREGAQYYNGYPDTSKSRGLNSNISDGDDESDKSRTGGGLLGVVSEIISQARQTMGSKFTAPSSSVVVPREIPMQQHHQARGMTGSFTAGSGGTVSPAPLGGSLPMMTTVSPPPSTMSNGYNNAAPVPYQAPPPHNGLHQQQQQQPLPGPGYPGSSFAPGAIAVVTAAPSNLIQPQQQQYLPQPMYQPPPPSQHLQQQQQQHLQQPNLAQAITTPISQPYYYQPGTGLVAIPLTLPAVPPQQQQQQPVYQQHIIHYTSQQYQPAVVGVGLHPASLVVTSASHQQLPVSFPPPHSAMAPAPSSSAPNTSATNTRAATPESAPIYLPGDTTRPLLGQGLFKIVPDAEDEEESSRATIASKSSGGGHSAQGSSNSALPLDLNLADGFLDAVISYENQDQRFMALQASRDGQSSKSRILLDKEEVIHEKQELDGRGQRADITQQDEKDDASRIVIVGSDIVLEPLPSAKAAARLSANLSIATDTDKGTTASRLDQLKQESSAKPNRPGLERTTTIGKALPTIGTEEYLERTDDKEEYSYGQHGDRRAMAGSSTGSPVAEIVHPPTRTLLDERAEGDIVVNVVDRSISPVAAPVLDRVPPPLARSTKPKMNY